MVEDQVRLLAGALPRVAPRSPDTLPGGFRVPPPPRSGLRPPLPAAPGGAVLALGLLAVATAVAPQDQVVALAAEDRVGAVPVPPAVQDRLARGVGNLELLLRPPFRL